LNGGSSAVSCSETPPLQPSGPLRLCRMERDGEDVQPANGSAGTLRILAASSGDWTVDGGKNSIYAPRPFSHSHLPIRPSLGPTTASVRTGRADPELSMALDGSRWLSISLANPHGEANGVLQRASHCSTPPLSPCHWDHQRWERPESNQGQSNAHRPYPQSTLQRQGTSILD
jgi:hypothetical protein